MTRKIKELRMDDVVFKPNLKTLQAEEEVKVQKSNSLSIRQAIVIVNRQMYSLIINLLIN
ncbi:hypothetical protein [Lysinibacillus fusiformis]|uniref:hypothetical protein n=2 Tax=Lysinibacillus fusiformis TaxID=28031 RepID=UPI000468B7B3|nr:hypothetical protein [Lysinibacillus fusiformis]